MIVGVGRDVSEYAPAYHVLRTLAVQKLYSVRCKLYSVRCKLYSVQYAA